MNKLLIDTNVLIYALDKNSIFNNKAVEILKKADTTLYLTSKNISEFFAVCTKLKVDHNLMLGFYEDIKNNTHILFPDSNSLSIFEILVKKYSPKGNQIYDMEIASIMLANSIDQIATFNVKDFANVDEIEVIENL